MDYAQPGGTEGRKQALIKALRSSRGGGAGGAARLSQSTPFGAIPRLGFRPDARSVFNRNENFNFSNSPQGQQDAFGAVSAPGLAQQGPPGQQMQMAGLDGFGPASGAGGGGGVPQNTPPAPGGPTAPNFFAGISSESFSGGGGGSTQHLLGYPGADPNRPGSPINGFLASPTSGGSIPGNVSAAINGDGPMSQGVVAWLQANPGFLEQIMGGGGGTPAGGGQVL